MLVSNGWTLNLLLNPALCQVISDSKTISNYIFRDNRFYSVIRYSELCRIMTENISEEDENASSDFKRYSCC